MENAFLSAAHDFRLGLAQRRDCSTLIAGGNRFLYVSDIGSHAAAPGAVYCCAARYFTDRLFCRSCVGHWFVTSMLDNTGLITFSRISFSETISTFPKGISPRSSSKAIGIRHTYQHAVCGFIDRMAQMSTSGAIYCLGGYLFLNCGVRFSTKASMPSF